MTGNVRQTAQERFCDVGEFVVGCFTADGKTYPHVGSQAVHERIVRCRDCHWCSDSIAWPGAFECDYINRGVEPNGYCAWGEFREG